MIDDDPRIDPADVRGAKFPGSFRRYDAKAVEDFLESVAQRVAATNRLVDDLRRDLDAARSVRKVEAPAQDPFEAPKLSNVSEEELVNLVGEETAHVLATARKAAADIRSKAEESAARVIREATTEADRLLEEAKARAEELTTEAVGARDAAVAEAEESAASIRAAAEAEAESLRSAARDDADAAAAEAAASREQAEEEAQRILEAARDEGRSMINEAKDVRSRVLEDLQRRRDLGRSQVERLIAGREQILAAYAAVRENVDDITAHLEEGLLDAPSDPALDEGFVGIVATARSDEAIDEAAIDEAVVDADGTEIDHAPEEAVAIDDAHPAPPDGESPADESSDVESSEVESSEVETLFARIRNERAESVARAQKVLAAEEGDVRAPAAERDDRPVTDAAAPPEAVGEADHVDRARLADEHAVDRRRDDIVPLDKRLSRALKRHLADEQNEVLDALRRTESTDPADLLPAEDEHVAGYAEVAAPELAAAADAGAATVGGTPVIDVGDLARSLGESLIAPFRRRIERSAADVDGDADALDERLRALYREWKVEHIGAATTDALLSAYAAGQLAAAPDGAALLWRIDPSQGPCPDAQDNALAGAITKGETFPTGDQCPQAHQGCRCLLVVEG
jgi:cell division septum initiation protein DivIVA